MVGKTDTSSGLTPAPELATSSHDFKLFRGLEISK